MGIVVVGAVFVDVKGYPEGTYIPGGRNKGWIENTHGGVGRNVAEDVANVNLRPTLVTLVDQTGAGQDVIDKLKRHNCNTDYIRATRNGMGTWLAVFDSTGDVTASISQRPDLSPMLQILEEQGDEIFRDADAVIVEIDIDKKVVKKAFELARKQKRSLTSISKGNALNYSMVFWDQIFEEVSSEYPDVTTHKYLVDAASMFMVKDPKRFEVVVTSNLFGDILTDLGAAIAGGMGLAAGANLNPERKFPSLEALKEEIHKNAEVLHWRREGNAP